MLIHSLIAAVLVAQDQMPPTTPPAAAPVPPVAAAPATACVDVTSLLDRVERAATGIRSLQADLTLVKYDDLNLETSYRIGRVVLDGVGTGRRIAVRFANVVVKDAQENQSTSQINERYVYENGWLWEIDEDTKSLKKRQVAPDGASYDPLKLGEGELPLPVGQSKQSVLERFDVSACTLPDAPLLKSLTDVEGLRLVPKADTALAKDYAELSLFYAKGSDPAVLHAVHIVHTNRNTVTIVLRDPRTTVIAASDQALLETPDPAQSAAAGWTVDVQRLRPKDDGTHAPPTAPPPDTATK